MGGVGGQMGVGVRWRARGALDGSGYQIGARRPDRSGARLRQGVRSDGVGARWGAEEVTR